LICPKLRLSTLPTLIPHGKVQAECYPAKICGNSIKRQIEEWGAPSSFRNFRRGEALFKTFFELMFSMLPARAGVTEPDPRAQDEFDFMNVLAKKGLHDLKDERWNAYGQFTYISSWKGAFPALYTNLNGSPNSLLPESERSFTGTATLYLGSRPQGAKFIMCQR
jgi:hypothetical protein